jgi:hypothetical protein
MNTYRVEYAETLDGPDGMHVDEGDIAQDGILPEDLDWMTERVDTWNEDTDDEMRIALFGTRPHVRLVANDDVLIGS